MTVQLIPQITTARLVLREWQPQDRAPFARMNADHRVAEHLGTPLDSAESDALLDRFVARWAAEEEPLPVREDAG